MPDIYYQHYTPVSAAIPDICAQEHALGRRLLLLGLSGLYGIHLSENELNQELKAAKNGKPWLPAFPGIHFNISHCDGLAVCAFDNTPVGVDVEMPGYFPEILIKKPWLRKKSSFWKARAAYRISDRNGFSASGP